MGKRKWTVNDLRNAAQNATSVRQALVLLGLREAGGNYAQIKKYFNEYNIRTDHFTGRGWSKGMKGIGKVRVALSDILVKNSNFQSYKLKKRLFLAQLKKPLCEICGWKEISKDGRIPLELDHINGINTDNRIENLRILCPNCHSLQSTHRGRNQKRYKLELNYM